MKKSPWRWGRTIKKSHPWRKSWHKKTREEHDLAAYLYDVKHGKKLKP